MIWFWAQILGLLLALYLVSRFFLQQFSKWLFALFKSREMVIKIVAIFLLPGTFIHEAAHLVFAEFMKVRTDDLTVMPEIGQSNTIKLGGVKIEHTDPLRRTIIGLAPVFLGLIIIWATTVWILNLNQSNWIILILYVYILLQVGLTMFSSAKDLEGSLLGLVLGSLLFWFLKHLGTIIIFAPFSRAEVMLGDFLNHYLPFLRQGLFLTCVVIVIFTFIIGFFRSFHFKKQ